MSVATRWPLVGRRDELATFVQALNDPGSEGFCIYGPSGVGKTRLGDECLALAATSGRATLRATADRSTDAVPLGAIAHLLPTDVLAKLSGGEVSEAVVHAALFDAARTALSDAAAGGAAPVLLLDDAHRFDSSSLAIVDRLLQERVVFGIATVVTGEPVPETVTRWWRDERAARIDLADLDAVGVDTLLHVALEGPLDANASSELWRVSQGNLLALRELVAAATARGSFVRRDGVWHLEGTLGTPDRLRELVEARIGELSLVARGVLELLALCQPVGLEVLERSAGLIVLEELERDGLVVVGTEGRRELVRLVHPIHADVVRAGMPALRARSILLEHADTIERFGARRREDPLRIATWRLEATGRADPALLLRAARLARYDHDYRQAVKLAGAALAAEPSAAAGLLLGEALYNLGSFEEAEVALAEATERAVGDDELLPIVTVRRRNLFRGCRRDDEAIAVGQRAAPRLTTDAARDELVAGEAEVVAVAGRSAEALALVEQVDASSPRLAVLVASVRGPALASIGRTAEALAVTSGAYREHVRLGDELAIAFPGTHLVTHTYALVQAGRLVEAEDKGRTRFEVANRGRSPLGVAWLAVHLGRGALLQGRPATALEWAERAVAAMATAGLEGLRPAACAVAAQAHALLGDAAASARWADRADDAAPSGFGMFATEIPLGRAWALVAAGERARARSVLLDAADVAEAAGHVPAAAWLLHDALRVGTAADAPEPASRLASLRTRTDSELVDARAAHAAVVVADDADRLVAAADRFEALAAALLAAETVAMAADSWRRQQEQRRAAALDVRVDQLLARCEGARTPGLARARAAVPLTDREREIALLAAEGQPSRAIAERLFLSVRTVDNHLSRIYAKLGVSSRAELAAALERGPR